MYVSFVIKTEHTYWIIVLRLLHNRNDIIILPATSIYNRPWMVQKLWCSRKSKIGLVRDKHHICSCRPLRTHTQT